MTETTETTSPADAPATETKTFSLEYVKELRAENKAARLKIGEFEATAKAAADAAAKAAADADAKIAEATAQSHARIIRAELKAHALAAGMHDLDGLKLADLSSVKLGDDGEVEGAEAMIAALKEAKPYLFASKATTTSAPGPAPKPVPTSPKSVKDMTPEQYRKAREAVARGKF